MIIEKNTALAALLKEHLDSLAAAEGLDPQSIADAVNAGTMVLLANPKHPRVKATLIGQPAEVKVNANIGTSQWASGVQQELRKLAGAEKAGAHTVMDLSTAGDLDNIRLQMLKASPLPLGTVPVYAVAQKYIENDEDPAKMTAEEILEEIAKQAEQGVDFMTVHCGVTRKGAEMAADGKRILGIVSRGGSILGRWMRENDAENPFLTHYDDILKICREYNVVLSLGDGLRPGAGADAGDAAQWEEVITLGQLQQRAMQYGVQAMIEGPGHVPLHLVETQIRGIKRLTHGAPLYVLGPLVTDAAPGYDHIAGAIGGALAVTHGVDFLCYLTPAEHLTLPDSADVYAGVMASRVAAQAGEAAIGRERAVQRDLDISQARKDLDWEKMTELALDPDMVRERRKEHSHEKECAMCGKFCAVRMMEQCENDE